MRVRQRAHSLRVLWAPSLARRFLRHRLVRLVAVAAIGLMLATSVSSKSAALDEQQAAWGQQSSVLIVQRPIAVGDMVADSVKVESWPSAMVPPQALAELAPGSLAKVDLYPGEVVLRQRVTGSWTSGDDAARVSDSAVALTVPIARMVPLLAVGDLVDLWAVDSANFSSRRVASNVVVLAMSPDDLTIAVDADSVSEVAAASLRPLTVTLVG